ncbi:MAG: hypothetical protein AAF125_10460 [Chloroflexota bacterium]
MTAFDAATVAADLNALREIYVRVFGQVADEDWGATTGTRDKDWALIEVTAHLYSIARAFNGAVKVGRRGEAVTVEGMATRTDLRTWNQAEMTAIIEMYTPAEMVLLFDVELERAADYAGDLSREELETAVGFPVYNRPAPVMNFIGWQLSHAAAVHGAQVVRPLAGVPPIWAQMGTETRQRLLGWFVRHFSWAYWPSHAPSNYTAVMHFDVAGEDGGQWGLRVDPDGGAVLPGAPEQADYRLRFADADTMFKVFTASSTFQAEGEAGKFEILDGDPRRLMLLLSLFTPSPPRKVLKVL